ncbi:MAG: Asp-tRNA(Asn)/Glu-tRNA(Gln) amidotransferase subunit GatB, partial [Burkholderiaceae bacterium]|nr:Asp-tRNA(Asn)/Glu-tRNA(Gln) amidotransferase subunit GatB [Burkholderiaceae bacterium]
QMCIRDRIPVVQGGALSFLVAPKGGEPYAKTVRLVRAHLEEDAGKSIHGYVEDDYVEEGYVEGPPSGMTGIDLNRAGTPLLEIVSEPDLRSAAEAVAYAKALHALVVWLGICDGNMQEGSFRCDANVSVRRRGESRLGTRCEIKNLNSFRFLQQAIEFEARRQIELLEDGGQVVQETRLFDPQRGQTRPLRSKEDAMDYRYFPDPDLLPLEITPAWIEQVRAALPELPAARRERLMRDYALPAYDAATLTTSRALADYFEAVAAHVTDKKAAANWVLGEVSAALNDAGIDIDACPVSPQQLAGLIERVRDGTISGRAAKEVFGALWRGEADSADAVIEARGLRQISDSAALEKLVDEVVAANPKSAAEFRAGKEKALQALIGQAMKASRGKANPQQVSELLRRKLTG